MKIRWLSERRMPTIWFLRIFLSVVLVLVGAVRWAVPVGLSTFSHFELKPGYYVNDLNNSRSSAVNPGLAFLSFAAAGLLFIIK